MMQRLLIKMLPLLAAALAVVSMASCKGRTVENMEPTGDTVEVTGLIPERETPVSHERPDTVPF